MILKDYRVSFILEGTLYIQTFATSRGEEGAAALIMALHNCPRAAITVQELVANKFSFKK